MVLSAANWNITPFLTLLWVAPALGPICRFNECVMAELANVMSNGRRP